jgi:hypothetical protein
MAKNTSKGAYIMRRFILYSGMFFMVISGALLSFVKHRALYVERLVRQCAFETQEASAQIKALRAEWALLMQPGRVQFYAQKALPVIPVEKQQVVELSSTYMVQKDPGNGEESIDRENRSVGSVQLAQGFHRPKVSPVKVNRGEYSSQASPTVVAVGGVTSQETYEDYYDGGESEDSSV